MNRLAVFDCDGTLVDSQATICVAMARGFAACGLPGPGDHATRGIIGLSLVEAMAMLHPQGSTAQHMALADAYKSAFFDLRTAGWRRNRSMTASPTRSPGSTRGAGCSGWRRASLIAD
jgi:phosphoglycolate phosphatase